MWVNSCSHSDDVNLRFKMDVQTTSHLKSLSLTLKISPNPIVLVWTRSFIHYLHRWIMFKDQNEMYQIRFQRFPLLLKAFLIDSENFSKGIGPQTAYSLRLLSGPIAKAIPNTRCGRWSGWTLFLDLLLRQSERVFPENLKSDRVFLTLLLHFHPYDHNEVPSPHKYSSYTFRNWSFISLYIACSNVECRM